MQSKNDRLILEFNRTTPSSWSDWHAIDPLSPEELRAAFENAHDFLEERKEELIQVYKWKESHVGSDDMLFNIVSPDNVVFCIPLTFSSFLDEDCKDEWTNIVRGCNRFDDISSPLFDILSMLQCIAPGMILAYKDVGTSAIATPMWCTGVPPLSWMDKHTSLLNDIFHNPGRIEELRDARIALDLEEANLGNEDPLHDRGDFFDDDDHWSRYDFTDNGGTESLDYEYCDLECGYCGECVKKVYVD